MGYLTSSVINVTMLLVRSCLSYLRSTSYVDDLLIFCFLEERNMKGKRREGERRSGGSRVQQGLTFSYL
jgi:hypothetical protein